APQKIPFASAPRLVRAVGAFGGHWALASASSRRASLNNHTLPSRLASFASGLTRLEAAARVRGAEAGRAVEPWARRAQVAAAAGAVAAGGDVVQQQGVRVRVGAVVDDAGVPRQRIDAG